MDTTDRRGTDRLLLRTARRGGVWLLAAGLTAVAMAVLETALPGVLGRAVDAVVGSAPVVWIVAASLIVVALALSDALDDLAGGMATARSTAWLRRGLLRHLLRIGATAGERYAPGDFAGRITGNATIAGRAGVDMLRTAVNVLPGAGALVALGLIDPWLCLTVAAGIPLLIVVLRGFLRDASGWATRYLAVQGRIAARLGDALAGARTIAASGTAQRETERVLQELPQLHREGVGMWRAQGRIAVQQGLLVPLLEVAVLALAGVELARGRITPGGLLAAAEYAVLATSLMGALPALTRLVRARAAAGRVREVMREPVMTYGAAATAAPRTPAAPSSNGHRRPQRREAGGRAARRRAGSIEFRGVTVRGGGRALLDGVDLVVRGGALTAVVGRSGAGKSLLVALAGRLRDPDDGDVLLDGIPLRELDHDTLRTAIGYGFERPALFGDTVADAIGFGVSRASAGAVTAAARHADADAFVQRLPQGYANPLVTTPLSGGEAQRLGLARAFAHAGRVLILDDVAASLDTVTDFHITSVLTGALAERTRIVVAHRASTAARAERVVWLEEGRVRTVSTHATLCRDAAYRAIFEPAQRPGRDPTGAAP